MKRKDVELLDGVWGKEGNGIEVQAERMATRQPFMLVLRKWVRVFHNAILKCSKTVFAGISHASRLFF